jgi:dienelactone hydrolase
MSTNQSPLRTEYVEYTDEGVTFEGYIAMPPSAHPARPGILIAHDWSGLNAGMRRITDRIATSGYVGFALDLYGRGMRGDESGDNSYLMAPLMNDRGLLRRRLLAGHAAAARFPGVDADRMAIMGYCFGGLCALDLVRSAPAGLLAAISFHGVLSPPKLGPQVPIKAKVLVLHGWEDPFAPPSDVVSLARELTEAGADWQLHAYGHALHAFTFSRANMPERGLGYNEAADRRSWSAMTAFLNEAFGDRERGDQS